MDVGGEVYVKNKCSDKKGKENVKYFNVIFNNGLNFSIKKNVL